MLQTLDHQHQWMPPISYKTSTMNCHIAHVFKNSVQLLLSLKYFLWLQTTSILIFILVTDLTSARWFRLYEHPVYVEWIWLC